MTFAPRTDFQRLLEPNGRILHGAGQSPEAFRDYQRRFHRHPACLTMWYWGVKNDPEKWLGRLRTELTEFSTLRPVPQIGVSMTHDGSPEKHYEHDVLAGTYDAHLVQFARGLKELSTPVIYRLGYEFNGHWNGYVAPVFVKAWHHVHAILRAEGPREAAFAWCFSPDGKNADYLSFYPGDDFVDWWSIDLFSREQFDLPVTGQFMRDALDRRYPVLIGESTPRYIGVADAGRAWDQWFSLYFGFMARYSHVKGFSYINWDWAGYPAWHDWGDGRVTANETLAARYEEVLNDPVFQHAPWP
jgi:hypothetical protein